MPFARIAPSASERSLFGNDEVGVEFHLRAETGARGARAVRRVERKRARLDFAERDVVHGAGEMLREHQVLSPPLLAEEAGGGDSRDEDDAAAEFQRGLDGIGDAIVVAASAARA